MLALATLLSLALSTVPAPSDGPCAGKPPAIGELLRGPVLHVLDGVTLCVALGARPDAWVPLQLVVARTGPKTNHGAPTRGTLMAVAFAQDVTCQVVGVSGGRTLADCWVDDHLIAERINDPDAVLQGRLWR